MAERKNEIFEAPPRDYATTGLTFEVPAIEVPLPSGGKVYPSGHPLSGQSSVWITAMTAAQENILTNRSLAKRGTLLTQLIQSCLRDRDRISAKDMLIGDRNTVMVALRISGYSAEYKVKVTCPDCDTVSTQEFALDQLPLRRLEIDPIDPGSNVFEFTLPASKRKVRFKFLTGIDEEDIAMATAQKKKIGADAGDLVTSGLLQAIISIDGVTDKSQISMAVPRMPAYDSQALRRYIQDHEPGMQLKGKMVCPSCDYVGEVDMPLGAGFFWPGAE